MSQNKLAYGKGAALIVEGDSLRSGTIVAAELNGGRFLSRTHELLDAEENARFNLTAIGQARNLFGIQRLTDGREITTRQAEEIRQKTTQKLGGASVAECIGLSFRTKRFEVVDAIQLPKDRSLSERQQQILQAYSEGFINKEVAHRLGIDKGYVAHLRDDMFRKLGTASVHSSVTVGHLAGILAA